MENYQYLINQDKITKTNLLIDEHNKVLENADFVKAISYSQKILEILPDELNAEIFNAYIHVFIYCLPEIAENEYFQKLQIALENQANQNVNLQIVLAKILIFQAQNTDDFFEEYQKLCKAKNLISNMHGKFIRYQKALIDLYLAKNSKKVLPPPDKINYKTYNQSSITNDFSTRNSKKFLEKSQKLWQKNQAEISTQIPNLKFFADEIKEFENIKITAFFTNGRAGSHFVHSLLDGHPQVSTIPSYCLRYFFATKMLQHLFPANIFTEQNWRENLIKRF